jgi:hypothetical protein
VQVVFAEKHGWDAWDVVFFEEGVLVDFVGADFDGFGVVNDFFAQFPGGFGNYVGCEQGVGGCPYEDGVVVGDVLNVFAEKEAKFVPIFLCRAFEIGEGAFLSWVTKIIFFNKACDLRH